MRKYRTILIWLILLLLPFLLGVLSLYVGSVKMTFREMLGLLFSWDLSDTAGTILLKIRFPRVVAAMFLGGALSVSGY
nr:iron chelate uptake ABC transporter family permease subunit [Lachnospiraceae bacterium]